jgi:hypothetical protein
MPGESSVVRVCAENALRRLLSEINEINRREEVVVAVSSGKKVAILTICDEGRVPDQIAPAQVRAYTDCERDIVAWFLSIPRGQKWKGEAIRRGMEKAGMIHGKRTVTNALTKLARLGLLSHGHDKSGYALASRDGGESGSG